MQRRMLGSTVATGLALWSSLGSVTTALAADYGHPVPNQIGFQKAVTPIARYIHWFHNDLILPIIVVICLFVAGLLLWCAFRFNETANPVPSRTTHHTGLEIAWTLLPVLILVVIAIPSFKLLTMQLTIPPADLTLKVTGKQWYWSYEYPKDQNGGFGFDSVMKDDADLKPDDIHLLSVDNEAVVPVDKVVRVQVTGADVIHSWVVQSLGARMDAVPGRLNETWFKADREGIYYGQCSKLCGKDHSYMPIAVRVVSQPQYDAWLQDAKKKYAANGNQTVADLAATSAVSH